MSILLDGGVGELLKRDLQSTSFLGGMEANVKYPEKVINVHRMFYEAAERGGWTGQIYATTNNFVATPYHCDKDYLTYVRAAVRCAKEAAGGERRRKVAGSLPPLGLCYAAAEDPDYSAIARVLVEEGVDILLAETLTTSNEAIAAVRAAAALRTKIWVCFTLADDQTARLRSGEPLNVAVAAVLSESSLVEGIGVNCCRVETVTAAIDALIDGAGLASEHHRPKHLIAYGNDFPSGSTSEWLRDIGRPDCCCRHDLIPTRRPYVDHVTEWIRRGVTVVGGCCGVGPSHIEAIARRVVDVGPEIPKELKDIIAVGGILFNSSKEPLQKFEPDIDNPGLLHVGFATNSVARIFCWHRWPNHVDAWPLYRNVHFVWEQSIYHAIDRGDFTEDDDPEQYERAMTHCTQCLQATAKRAPPILDDDDDDDGTFSMGHIISTGHLNFVAASQINTFALRFVSRTPKIAVDFPQGILRRIHAFLLHDLTYFRGRPFHYKFRKLTLGPYMCKGRRGCGVITADGIAIGFDASE